MQEKQVKESLATSKPHTFALINVKVLAYDS